MVHNIVSKVGAFFSKNPLVAGFLFLALVIPLPLHWTEVAKHSFWWTLWEVLGIVGVISCLSGWVYLNSRWGKR